MFNCCDYNRYVEEREMRRDFRLTKEGVIMGVIIMFSAFLLQKCATVHKLHQLDGTVKTYKQPRKSGL